MKNSKRYRFVLAVIIWMLMVTVVYLVKAMSFNDHHYVATVIRNETINYGGPPYYLVSVQDDDGNCYALRNDDNLFRLKFNSSKIYDEIIAGKTYDFTVVGFRVEQLFLFENIIEIEEVG